MTLCSHVVAQFGCEWSSNWSKSYSTPLSSSSFLERGFFLRWIAVAKHTRIRKTNILDADILFLNKLINAWKYPRMVTGSLHLDLWDASRLYVCLLCLDQTVAFDLVLQILRYKWMELFPHHWTSIKKSIKRCKSTQWCYIYTKNDPLF